MNILLVRPAVPGWFNRFNPVCTEPLELEYLSATAKAYGFKVSIHDELIDTLYFVNKLKQVKPDLVAFTGYITVTNRILLLASQTKQIFPGVFTMVGGVHAEINADTYKAAALDIIVHSGGLATFKTLLDVLNKDNVDFNTVKGISFQTPGGRWIDNPSAQEDYNNLPLADREHFHTHRRRFTYLYHGPCALLKTSFGCPYQCKFCYCRLLNNGKFTQLLPEAVIRELSQIECETVWIVDDCFGLDKKWLLSFRELLQQSGIHKQFIIYCRADYLVEHPYVLEIFKSIGVIEVIVGLEAVNDRELESHNKNVSSDQNRKCLELLKQHGILSTALFIVDTKATAKDFSLLGKWIQEHRPDHFTLSIFSPFPGTDIYNQYKARFTTDDCRKWDLLHLVMKPLAMSSFMFYLRFSKLQTKLLLSNRQIRTMTIKKLLPGKPGKQKNIWDFWASRYDRLWVQKVSLGPTRKRVFPIFDSIIPKLEKDIHILDMSCGTGQLIEDIKRRYPEKSLQLTGVDYAKNMIEEAKRRLPAVKLFHLDVDSYDPGEERFDVIVCTHAFPYYPHAEKTLTRFAEWLKPGGLLLLAQACINNNYDRLVMTLVKLTTSSASYRSQKQMKLLLQEHFAIHRIETIKEKHFMPSLHLFHCSKK
ncbi:MAG: methyltransferase domain-containing protein [Fibrobacteria bacterium]|nr:methyltransferase domain-containing protein [Fibrobacteria bacterium]